MDLGSQEAKSVLTNSARLTNVIETSNCSNSEDVIREIKKELKGGQFGKGIRKKGFEQHMLEEDQVRVDWKSGKFEQRMACNTCGDKNAWGRVHQCCQAQCDGTLNALQAFPYAA